MDDLAKDCDLVYPVRATYPLYENNKQTGISFYTAVYDYLRQKKSDIYLLEYANTNNWAGNIFGLSEVKEEWFHHIPYNNIAFNNRIVPSWWTSAPCPYNPGVHTEYVFNRGSSPFADFFVSKAVDALRYGNKLDGLFLDNSGLSDTALKVMRCDGTSLVNDVPENPATGKDYTNEQQNVEVKNIFNRLETAISANYPNGSWQGRKIIMPINIGRDIINDEWNIINQAGGALSEGPGWIASDGSAYFAFEDGLYKREPVYSVPTWKYHIDSIKRVLDNGNMFMLLAKGMNVDANSDGAVDDLDWAGYPNGKLLFIYASSLLGAGRSGDQFYFKYGSGNSFNVWAGFDIDIGYADGDYFKWPGTNNVYARRYGSGLVLVNPSGTNETVNPGVTYRSFQDNSINSLKWKGLGVKTSAAINLEKYSAAILVFE